MAESPQGFDFKIPQNTPPSPNDPGAEGNLWKNSGISRAVNGLFDLLVDENSKRFRFPTLSIVILVAVTLVSFFQDNSSGRLQSIEGLIRACFKVITVAGIVALIAGVEQWLYRQSLQAESAGRRHRDWKRIGSSLFYFVLGCVVAATVSRGMRYLDRMGKATEALNKFEESQRVTSEKAFKKALEDAFGPNRVIKMLSGRE